MSRDVEEELQGIKDQTDGEIVISGSATLVRSLLSHGLLDELRLLLHPLAVGHGARLFEDQTPHTLELVDHDALSTGVLNLTYVPARA